MNELIRKLNIELEKHNLGCAVVKEYKYYFKCYLYELDDCVKAFGGLVDDYGNCKKLDVQYNKNNLSTIIATGHLKSFCEQEKHTFDMAKTMNVLRQ